MAAGRVLDGFTALVPSFPPTFKRTRGARIALENRDNKVCEWDHWYRKDIQASSIHIQGTREGSRRQPSVSVVSSSKGEIGDNIERLPSPSSSVLFEDSISLASLSENTVSYVFDKDTKSVDDDKEEDDDEVLFRPIMRLHSLSKCSQESPQHYSYLRIPSYTDRIVYKSLPHFKKNLQPLYFQSCERMIT